MAVWVGYRYGYATTPLMCKKNAPLFHSMFWLGLTDLINVTDKYFHWIYIWLQADIDCMKDHLAHNVHWRYVINLAGQAYPLRTPEEMVDILRIYNGANDIEGIYKRQYKKRYLEVSCLLINVVNAYADITDPACTV